MINTEHIEDLFVSRYSYCIAIARTYYPYAELCISNFELHMLTFWGFNWLLAKRTTLTHSGTGCKTVCLYPITTPPPSHQPSGDHSNHCSSIAMFLPLPPLLNELLCLLHSFGVQTNHKGPFQSSYTETALSGFRRQLSVLLIFLINQMWHGVHITV